eukprot:TRINITY_DN48945_c0_g1_i1.p1 TRINITY_DN48945_c0_g1~~TRINITY_DN48945_c0_g1_i1.p1  ORF type:complete len:195 (+),score=39.78 TRINITY_DN48945_c0_g1_i1:64-648(+)
MVSMQEILLQKKLDAELPERAAERDLQAAQARLAEDIVDIQLIEKWHISTIQPRMVEWQSRFRKSCPFDGEVLFCDSKLNADQECVRILQKKKSLVKAWYEDKHGLKNVGFIFTPKKMFNMRFGFYSADVEEKVRSQMLEGRRKFEAHVRVALQIIRTQATLPVHVLKIIKQFIPDYIEHLKQEKESIERASRW